MSLTPRVHPSEMLRDGWMGEVARCPLFELEVTDVGIARPMA